MAMKTGGFLSNYLSRKTFYVIGIVITLVLSIIIAVLAFFGQNLGNMTISADTLNDIGIQLDESIDFTDPRSRLAVKSLDKADQCTYSYVADKIEKIKATNGYYEHMERTADNFDGLSYIAYTFYIRNEGTSVAELSCSCLVDSATRSVDEAYRFLLYTDDVLTGLYKKSDPQDYTDATTTNKNYLSYQAYIAELPVAETSYSGSTVFTQSITSFRPGQTKKYTFVIYLEGNDPDCVDSIRTGKLTLSMNFTAVKENA